MDTSDWGVYVSGGSAQKVENIFTGLDHVEGETVAICGTDVDDVTDEYDSEVVDSGSVTTMTLSPHVHNFVRKATIGLPYRYTLSPMRMDVPGEYGNKAKIAKVYVNFYKTKGAKYGKDVNNLKSFTGLGNEFGDGVTTGQLEATLDAGFTTEDHFVISSNSPLPCTVRSIIIEKEVTD